MLYTRALSQPTHILAGLAQMLRSGRTRDMVLVPFLAVSCLLVGLCPNPASADSQILRVLVVTAHAPSDAEHRVRQQLNFVTPIRPGWLYYQINDIWVRIEAGSKETEVSLYQIGNASDRWGWSSLDMTAQEVSKALGALRTPARAVYSDASVRSITAVASLGESRSIFERASTITVLNEKTHAQFVHGTRIASAFCSRDERELVTRCKLNGEPAAVDELAALLPTAARSQVLAVVPKTELVARRVRDDADEEINQTVSELHSKGIYPKLDVEGIYKRHLDKPENRAALADAKSIVVVQFRIDRTYQAVRLNLEQLVGYATTAKTFSRARPVAAKVFPDFRPHPDPKRFHQVELELPELPVGAYRLTVVGETQGSTQNNIDQRLFKFDGTSFREVM